MLMGRKENDRWICCKRPLASSSFLMTFAQVKDLVFCPFAVLWFGFYGTAGDSCDAEIPRLVSLWVWHRSENFNFDQENKDLRKNKLSSTEQYFLDYIISLIPSDIHQPINMSGPSRQKSDQPVHQRSLTRVADECHKSSQRSIAS